MTRPLTTDSLHSRLRERRAARQGSQPVNFFAPSASALPVRDGQEHRGGQAKTTETQCVCVWYPKLARIHSRARVCVPTRVRGVLDADLHS